MTHLTPLRIIFRRSIRIRKSKRKSRRTLHVWTIYFHNWRMFRLGLLELVPINDRSLLLAIERSNEAFWLEVVNDSIDYVCFLQTEGS